jgi:hypothetical protein
MHASVRTFATASVALVGASVISVTPIAPSQPDIRVASPAVRLAAASAANVPVNLSTALVSAPANLVQGLERLAAALELSGSWNESHPNNVWGWDPANPEMLKGMIDLLVPFPALSGPLGEHLNWWVAANFPMYAGCAFECPDPIGMLNVMFRVPIWEFYDEDGYTFPEVINPVSGLPTEWSGQTVRLDPLEPITSVINYLLRDQSENEIETVTPYEVITAVANFAAALQITGHLPTWIAVREIETFFKSFFPAPVTSIAPASDSVQMLTLGAAALGGDVQQGEDLGEEMGFADGRLTEVLGKAAGSANAEQVGSADVEQDGLASGRTASTPDATGLASDVVTTVKQQDVAAGAAALGPDTAVEASPDAGDPPSTAPTVPLINLTRDSLKAEPGQFGPKHRAPGGGLAGAVKSVGDQFGSAISRISDGLRGGGAESGESSPGEAGTGE